MCFQEKEKKMTDKVMQYAVEFSEFETYPKAVEYAQKRATKAQEDVQIWNLFSTVKYPIPTLDVVMAPAPTETPTVAA
jgi:hypothetical protein